MPVTVDPVRQNWSDANSKTIQKPEEIVTSFRSPVADDVQLSENLLVDLFQDGRTIRDIARKIEGRTNLLGRTRC